MKKRSISILCVFLCLLTAGMAEELRYKYAENDRYRILSVVNEDVYVNGRFSHHAVITNRIAAEITGITDGRGIHSVTFMTTEQSSDSSGTAFSTWGEEYSSVFERDVFGKYLIDPQYFMPVVRNVPVFPSKNLNPGDTWTANGEEAHDMRQAFNLKQPFKVSFPVEYQYVGIETKNDKTLHKILARYTIDFKNPNKPTDKKSDYPIKTSGHSTQIIYWDNNLGTIDSYTEKFRITLDTARGNRLEFRGDAQAESTFIRLQDTEKKRAVIEQQIQQMGIADTEVRSDNKGITISVENIQFLPDSTMLTESESAKLQKIANILRSFPENDLLVSGHTAFAGTETGRDEISKQRADSVANFLIKQGIRDRSHIFTQGLGANQPIADNTTPHGREKNRRVEITILD